MLGIEEIENKKTWEDFLSGCDEKTFLQAWNWGEFQKMMGNKIWRLGIYENNDLKGLALVIKIAAKRGTFLFCPHGPAFAKATAGKPSLKFEVLKLLLEELKIIAKKEGVSFIRISPIWQRNKENIEVFKNLGFREAPIHMHAEETWELDISLDEEEILGQMRKTTRYLIRQGLKNPDLKIEISQKLEDLEAFNQIYQETVDRQHFIPFSLEYLKNEFLAFLPDYNPPATQPPTDHQIAVFLGKYKNEILAGGIFIFWQNIGFYHHGATSLKYPKIPISYLLIWEALREAKKRQCQRFNFWGIAPINSEFRAQTSEFRSHPWAGLTLFKTGFGGYKKEYVKTQDLPLSKKYWLTYIIEKLRKTKRGL